jgi:hypothetical protein
LGLDQQYDLHLDIIPVSLQAQVNSELQDLEFISDSGNLQGKDVNKR